MNLKSTYLEQKTIQALLSFFCILSVAYCSILVAIVFSVIERKQNVVTVTNLTNQLMEEENRYASTLSTLDGTTLSKIGFEHFDATTFAVRKDPIATYALLYAR